MKPSYDKFALMNPCEIKEYFISYYSRYDDHALFTLIRYLENPIRRPRKSRIPYCELKAVAVNQILTDRWAETHMPF